MLTHTVQNHNIGQNVTAIWGLIREPKISWGKLSNFIVIGDYIANHTFVQDRLDNFFPIFYRFLGT